MEIIKLDSTHKNLILPLFENEKYMGAELKDKYFLDPSENPVNFYHEAFSNTYLSGLNSFHAYGAKDESGNIVALISFYESSDDASWYATNIRNIGDRQAVRSLLETAMRHNEANGRFKFYALWSAKHSPALRRFIFTEWANERYDYFDEFYVPAKHQCKFNLHWQVLYNRTLIPVDTVIRCTFLKQKYRTEMYNAGRL